MSGNPDSLGTPDQIRAECSGLMTLGTLGRMADDSRHTGYATRQLRWRMYPAHWHEILDALRSVKVDAYDYYVTWQNKTPLLCGLPILEDQDCAKPLIEAYTVISVYGELSFMNIAWRHDEWRPGE